MDTMVKEKDAAIAKGNFEKKIRNVQKFFHLATAFEAESIEFDTTAHKFEKEVDSVQRDIAKVEDQLDIAISSTKVNYIFISDQNITNLGNWRKTRSRRQGGH